MRTFDQQVKDMLLELFLLEKASGYREMDSRMKVQKLHFLSQKQMTDNETKGTDLKFFTYRRGPYSKLLANDLRALQKLGLVTKGHQVTDRGKEILGRYREVFERESNAVISSHIQSILEEYGRLSAEQLEKIALDVRIKPAGVWVSELVRVGELPAFIDLLVALDEAESKAAFKLTDEELESLELTFCWTEEDLEEMRRSSAKTYDEIFAGV